MSGIDHQLQFVIGQIIASERCCLLRAKQAFLASGFRCSPSGINFPVCLRIVACGGRLPPAPVSSRQREVGTYGRLLGPVRARDRQRHGDEALVIGQPVADLDHAVARMDALQFCVGGCLVGAVDARAQREDRSDTGFLHASTRALRPARGTHVVAIIEQGGDAPRRAGSTRQPASRCGCSSGSKYVLMPGEECRADTRPGASRSRSALRPRLPGVQMGVDHARERQSCRARRRFSSASPRSVPTARILSSPIRDVLPGDVRRSHRPARRSSRSV